VVYLNDIGGSEEKRKNLRKLQIQHHSNSDILTIVTSCSVTLAYIVQSIAGCIGMHPAETGHIRLVRFGIQPILTLPVQS